MERKKDLTPKLAVVGVGGAGSNAVNNMIRSGLEGVDFTVANTDAQALQQSLAAVKMQLGPQMTQGLGAGSRPDIGKAAAEESLDEIISHLKGANMIFVTAGMGGGTGTGSAPVIAKAARESGILTVGVVTRPFHFEGAHRMHTAEQGIEEMHKAVDTLLVIPNQNLFRLATERTTFADAFAMADDVLYSGVRTFTDLMIKHGLINLDFADICSVMREMKGKAMMGTGQASGDRRAIDAAEQAISCPLLDNDVTMKGARAVLINISGGPDMTLFEVDEAANRIREEVDPSANIIFGATFDDTLNGELRVAIVATGIDATEAYAEDTPHQRRQTTSIHTGAEEAYQANKQDTSSGRDDYKNRSPITMPGTAPSNTLAQDMPAALSRNSDMLGAAHHTAYEPFPARDEPATLPHETLGTAHTAASENPLFDSPKMSKNTPSSQHENQWSNIPTALKPPAENTSPTVSKKRSFSLLERLGMRRTSNKKSESDNKTENMDNHLQDTEKDTTVPVSDNVLSRDTALHDIDDDAPAFMRFDKETESIPPKRQKKS